MIFKQRNENRSSFSKTLAILLALSLIYLERWLTEMVWGWEGDCRNELESQMESCFSLKVSLTFSTCFRRFFIPSSSGLSAV